MKKVMLILVAVMLAASTAWAGNVPEFDAVGCDVTNVFAVNNTIQYGQVSANNIGPFGPINYFSDFTNLSSKLVLEKFSNKAGQAFPDPCFGYFGLYSHLTDMWNEGSYEWIIVLQMKPESDLNINIYDCVLKHNVFDIWTGAEQTGRYREAVGQLMFIPGANPSITAVAYPGEYATPGFTAPFTLDARRLPDLTVVPLSNQLYTSKALWSEGIVVVMPETKKTNQLGQNTYNLKQGDQIKVTITIPYNNTCDIRYAKDSVILKYIAIVGTYYYNYDKNGNLLSCVNS